jgi:selenocysteine-specific elongation factor
MRGSTALDRASASAEPSGGPRLVLGTAGHIDHGKTSLVRALTGVDTDRLPEEKARGITIELGFAPLDLEGGLRLGLVDVPGHEGLVRTMVAGASGIDLVLLVVAADEGVMPQTREHLAICELLGVRSGVVALTKTDLAGAELAELAAAEVAEWLAATALAGAEIVPVSSLTGEGLEELRRALAEAARAAAPRTPRSGPPRLPIDRCFAMRGFGAVVTGTLVGGALAVGDAVEIQPGGRGARVRGLQLHGSAVPRAAPGARCAVNLQGIELAELARGQVVTAPGALAPTQVADVRLAWLESAPATSKPVAVELLAGTSQRRARVAPIGARALRPGESGFARLHVEGDPLPLLPGDRFVVRGFARTALGGTTLGGGIVLDVAPPRRRRSDPALTRELALLEGGELATGLAVRLRRAGLAGMPDDRLRREVGLPEAALEPGLGALRAEGRAFATSGGTWLDAAALAELETRLLAALDAYHAAEPLRPGMPTGTLRACLPANAPRDAAELALLRLAARGEIAVEGETARRPAHRPRLADSEASAAERIAERLRAAGLDPPGLRELGLELGMDAERLRDLLAHLERESRIVRAREDLWFDRAAVDALRERVRAHLREHGRIETLAYKALIGTTRRTAIPLMELFDAERLTLRRGDVRTLRGGAGR